MFITYEDFSQESVALKYNENAAAEYLKYYRQMAQQFGLEDDVRVSALGRCPEVFTMEEQEIDEEEMWSMLEEAVKGACLQFVQERQREGEALRQISLTNWR